MKRTFQFAISILLATLIASCTSKDDPGRLEGTWKLTGIMPMTVIYRDGEEESMGMISPVSYEHEGNDVLVTYKDGMAKGTTIRITFTGANSANTGFGKLTRIK